MATSDVEIELGVRLLDMLLAKSSLIKQRHDQLLIVDLLRAEQNVLVGIALADYEALVAGGLQAHHDRILVPLIALDADTDQTAYAVNEAGELMPHYPERDLVRYLGAGLVGFARHANGVDRLNDTLEREIRRLPASAQLPRRESSPAAMGLDDALAHLIDTSPLDAAILPLDAKFRSGLRAVLEHRFSVVLLDPSRGPFRMLRYHFYRHLQPPKSQPTTPWSRLWSALARSGGMDLVIPLPGVGGSASYTVKVDAPRETWFSEPSAEGFADRMVFTRSRTSLLGRVASPPDDCEGRINVHLAAEPTGVIRAGVWGSSVVLLTCTVGTILVAASRDLDLPGTDDGSTALLLLFPGIVASLLAPAPEHPLVATFQFPTRFVLWALGIVMFCLAASTALGAQGRWNLALWSLSMVVSIVCTISLFVRFRRLSRGA